MPAVESVEILPPSLTSPFPVYKIKIIDGKKVTVWDYPEGVYTIYDSWIAEYLYTTNNTPTEGHIIFENNRETQFYFDYLRFGPSISSWNYWYYVPEEDAKYILPDLIIGDKIYNGDEEGRRYDFWTDFVRGVDDIHFIFRKIWFIELSSQKNLLGNVGETTNSTINVSENFLAFAPAFYLTWGNGERYTVNFYLDGNLKKSIVPMDIYPSYANDDYIVVVFHEPFNELRIEVVNESSIGGTFELAYIYYKIDFRFVNNYLPTVTFGDYLSDVSVTQLWDDASYISFGISQVRTFSDGFISYSGNLFQDASFYLSQDFVPIKRKVGEKRFPETGEWTAYIKDVFGKEIRRNSLKKSGISDSTSKVLNCSFKNRDFMGKMQYSLGGFQKNIYIEVE